MFDLFISHASEDKKVVVEPLYLLLKSIGFTVWYDKFEIKLGDSIRSKINLGLRESRYGLVILSPDFFVKKWTQDELAALSSLEEIDSKRILPIWYNISEKEIKIYDPLLAGKFAVKYESGLDVVTKKIIEVVGYPKHNELTPLNDNCQKELYISVCSDVEAFIEFCSDIVEKDDFRKSTPNDIVDNVPISMQQKIISALIPILNRRHLKLLFQLCCLIYDKSEIGDDLISKIINRGLSEDEILDAYAYCPQKASNYLCKKFIRSIENCSSSFPSYKFETICYSKSFLDYCITKENIVFYEIISKWEKENFTGVHVGDAVQFIVGVYERVNDIKEKYKLKRIVVSWKDNHLLDDFFRSESEENNIYKMASWFCSDRGQTERDNWPK